MLPAPSNSSAGPVAAGRPAEGLRPKTLTPGAVPQRSAVSLSCASPWGRYVARVDVASGALLADAVERLHRRLLIDLERVAERTELDASGASLGLSSLLARPEHMAQRVRFLGRSGVQSAGDGPAHVTIRVELNGGETVAEHTIDPDLVAPLCGALLGSGARVSPEACIVGVVVGMLHEELAR